MRRRIVAGNWKMNKTRADAEALASAVAAGAARQDAVEVVVCPPFPYLIPVAEKIAGSKLRLGAQNCYPKKEGAFTGEVSPAMLLDVGCQYVILGHSERRHVLREDDPFINEKVRLAMEVGLRVILCVGETRQEREEGRMVEVFYRQLGSALAGVTAENLDRFVIAYEPVWAIGVGGTTATPEQAQQAHHGIRAKIAEDFDEAQARALTILYGGNVNDHNARELFSQPDVDGGLIGGASLKADAFLAIVRAAVETHHE
jgi:triosephosphate isomerase